ncbi:AMP-binding protein [Actinoplanes sp. DH11]|uniref:AMP-binding protein n=1 Tax=Actinoplanes sp. DH11 TaxID=2857011 RepID=UPI001E61225A|nr:AMP-binding protein [Actinoplanes sp. DH11]
MSASLYELFASTAERLPEAIAVELPTGAVSYRELSMACEAVAECVAAAHGDVRRVGLLATRSLVAYAGYLAVLRLGAAVVPLSVADPARRHREIQVAAGLDLVIADATARHRDVAEVVLTDDAVRSMRPAGTLPPYRAVPDSEAYVLFTSGTTGRPKGIPIRHRNVVAFIERNIARFEVGPDCRMSHSFDLTFDPSVFDLFVTWGGGGVLVVPSPVQAFSPLDYITQRRLTHWFSVPSVIAVSRQLGRFPESTTVPLRYSVFGGEQVTYDQVRAWHRLAPQSRIDNIYGPTELSVACAQYRLPADPKDWPPTGNGTVPIGYPHDDLDHVILEDTGELCVRGPQRFDGYLDEAENRDRFLGHTGPGRPAPEHYFRTGDRVRRESGELVHLGRLDDQVKVRGFRTELAEVELAVRQVPGVREAVVATTTRNGVTELVAGYTGTAMTSRELQGALRGLLPVPAIPRVFLHLDVLPLNSRGKADRDALRRLAAEAPYRQEDACSTT